MQDLSIVSLVREYFPDFPIHASTQMTVHSLDGVIMAEKLGVKRVVLARELSEKEIKYICDNSNIEIEVFVHGALCMCLSGQCYLSSMLGGRSGNRGLCAQPCRLPFAVKNGTGHDLSLKDMSYIEHISTLASMGVCSFKIEGRMKSPCYVGYVTKMFRILIDKYYNFYI